MQRGQLDDAAFTWPSNSTGSTMTLRAAFDQPARDWIASRGTSFSRIAASRPHTGRSGLRRTRTGRGSSPPCVGVARELLAGDGPRSSKSMVDDALLRIDQRRELGEQHAAHGDQVALALHHAAELARGWSSASPARCCARSCAQVADHRVDVVLQLGHFAARLDLDRARQVALGHRGRDFGDGAHLRGEVRRRAGSRWRSGPSMCRPRRARSPGRRVGLRRRLRAPPLVTWSAKVASVVGHGVDGVRERGDFALRLHRQPLAQVAIGHRGHHLDDAAHLVRQVVRHRVDVVGEVLPRPATPGTWPGRRACLRCRPRAPRGSLRPRSS